ncbi:MAG: Serine/threonine kinase [Phylliscum demangeonii]|nr:MAG: Serine/threonine kinase [Phylliscum demangeonii]
MADDPLISDVSRKIEREQRLIDGAISMRQSTDNQTLHQRLDAQIHEGRKNIDYLTEKMRELQLRRSGQAGDRTSDGGGHDGFYPHGDRDPGPVPPASGPGRGYGTDLSGYGDPGPGGYSQQSGGHIMMPPRPPYDLIKYDTPYLGPRIQLMLSQLEFKLSVEKQYKDGIEKMVRLYHMEGDRKSKADAEARRIESNQKIQLLKQALKRYEDLHVDTEGADAPDDDSLNTPNMRKPLTGQFSIRIHAVQDVDHAATSRFSKGPETFVVIKVEDSFKGRTRPAKGDKWQDELHTIDVEKANEIELTVYDKLGDHPLPIGMLWLRISDIAEEMRRKKIESEFNTAGWVSADKMGAGSPSRPETSANMTSAQYWAGTPSVPAGPGQTYNNVVNPAQPGSQAIETWFALEPAGRILLTVHFAKQMKDRSRFDAGLNRKGAIRQRKEEVHEMYGHKFVTQQFYNIMRCALCGDFLKYAAGMQCADCKYTCHKKCYPKVVTKCISKSNAETDPEEEKLNHRIPHRFTEFSNMGANWCCHCGYILPLGRKNCRKCSECGLTCHAQCQHFVPDFCGMSMEVANQILSEIRTTKRRQITSVSNMSSRNLRPSSGRPTPPPGSLSYIAAPGPELYGQQPVDPRRSSGPDPAAYEQQMTVQGYAPTSAASLEAAKASFTTVGSSSNVLQQRPGPGSRTTSSQPAAAAAAAAALTGRRTPSQQGPLPYQRTSTDYAASSSMRAAAGYAPTMESRVEVDPNYAQARPGQHAAGYPSQAQLQATYDPAAYAAVTGFPVQPQAQAPLQQAGAGRGYKPSASSMPPPDQPQQVPLQPPYQVSAQVPQAHDARAPAPQQPPPPRTQSVSRKATPSYSSQGSGRRIGLDHFNFLAVLGKGNFGKVMLAETKTSKQLYAIKVLKKEFIIENDEVESTRSEKRVFLIANKERHPFLLNLHACFQTETRVYFVMEYISGGDLMLHIQRGQFGTKRAQFYAAEVCLALKYFHENGVIYRDLKLDNILLTLDGHIKIADYGLCKEDMWHGSTTTTFCGTPEFMAPEILLDKKYGRAVDWWAFGVLIYQMLLQQSPFRGEDEDEIYDAILADEPLYPIHMPRDSVSILQKLLTREPELRLGSGPNDAQEIMSHAFFRNINWDDVYLKRIPAPFLPQISSATDTSNFDSEFTSVTPVLTPVQSVLSQAMQEQFRGFSYSADFV